jgi:hypothetical protein
MMFLTVADVLMRAGGRPILGTYEMVALSLALVIGFSIPNGGTFIWKLYRYFTNESECRNGKTSAYTTVLQI